MPHETKPPRTVACIRVRAAALLQVRSETAVAARAFRRWSLLATATVYRDVAAVRESSSAAASASVPSFMVECMGCADAAATTQRLRAALVRIHERLASRDRLVAYYATQRDSAVQAAERATAQLQAAQSAGTGAAQPAGPSSLLPPPLSGVLAESAAAVSRTTRQRASSAELIGRHLLPTPAHRVETELRQRVRALEGQLRKHEVDPAKMVWPAALLEEPLVVTVPSPLASSTNNATAGGGKKTTPRGDKQTTPRAAARRRAEASAAASEVAVVKDASVNPNDSDPIGISPGPQVDDTPPGSSVISTAGRPLSSCDSIVDEATAEDGDTATTPTAPAQPAPTNRTRAHLAKQATATPGALVGTRRPENAPATLSALDEPTTPSRTGNATIGRPLRLHRAPAEALQVSQPAPIHPRGFPPSSTIHRTGPGGTTPSQTTPAKARAAASSAPTAQSNGPNAGSSNKAAYRVQPQRQPTMSVRSRSGSKR